MGGGEWLTEPQKKEEIIAKNRKKIEGVQRQGKKEFRINHALSHCVGMGVRFSKGRKTRGGGKISTRLKKKPGKEPKKTRFNQRATDSDKEKAPRSSGRKRG